MKKDTLIFCLTLALIATTGIAVYALLGKRYAAPPAVYVFESRKLINKLNEQAFNQSFFWDNFPYHVVANNGKKIRDVTLNRDNKNYSLKELLDKRSKIVYRYLSNIHPEVSDTTLKIIRRLNLDNLIILSDLPSSNETLDSSFSASNFYYVNQEQFDEKLDRTAISYFCVISPDLSIDRIYFPQKENISLIEKYLNHNNIYLNTK